jgi:hypothetical protein
MPSISLLDRDRSLAQARPLIDSLRPPLVDAANYGAQVFGRLVETPREGEVQDERLAILFSYLTLVEMLDGVEVLVSGAAPVPARLALRTQFEALLTIDFILREDTRRRALAWLVCHLHRRIAIYETHDPKTARGAEYQRDYSEDSFIQNAASQPVIDSYKPVAQVLKMLSLPHLKEAEEEYQRIKSLKKRRRWYCFHDGPTDLRALAKRCRRGAQYGLLYTEWSGTSHADDLHRQLVPTKDQTLGVRVIREVSELKTAAHFALTFFIDATLQVMKRYRPQDLPAWRVWYRGRLQEPYTRMPTFP